MIQCYTILAHDWQYLFGEDNQIKNNGVETISTYNVLKLYKYFICTYVATVQIKSSTFNSKLNILFYF